MDVASLLRQLQRAADVAAGRVRGKRRALTDVVRELVPLARHQRVPDCRGCRAAKRSTPRGIVVRRANPPLAACGGGRDARQHGVLAEAHVNECLAGKRTIEDADPCARMMLKCLHDAQLEVVATQVRIVSARLSIVAYADFLCVDAATRTRLTLIEMKAARGSFNDLCYVYEPAAESSAVAGLGCSARNRDMLQLWAMATTLREEAGLGGGDDDDDDDAAVLPLSRALLVRVQPLFYRVESLADAALDSNATSEAFSTRSDE